MLDDAVMDVVRQALIVVLMIAAPLLLIGMILGLIISLFQSVTSIQDQTLTFVPKILAIIVAAILLLPWIVATIGQFAVEMMQLF